MTLPKTGKISLSMIAAEFGLSIPVNFSDLYGIAYGIPLDNSEDLSISMFRGAGEYIEVSIDVDSENLDLTTLLTTQQMISEFPKRIVIEAGVTIGSKSNTLFALKTGSMNGELVIDNYGEIQGCGGRSGVNGNPGTNGGGAILVEKNGTIINNYGAIRGAGGGGGSGGKGGDGGEGSYSSSFRDPFEGSLFSIEKGLYVVEYYANDILKTREWKWKGETISTSTSGDSAASGEFTYFRGDEKKVERKIVSPSMTSKWIHYSIYRVSSFVVTSDPGQGGNYSSFFSDGGEGRGYKQDRTNGFEGMAGRAGGTNSGKGGDGGAGGRGGDWGTNGQNGQAGQSGENGSSTSGSPGELGKTGGTGGVSVTSNATTYVLNNFGTING